MRASLTPLVAFVLVSGALSGCLADDAPRSRALPDVPGAVDLVAANVKDGLARLADLREDPMKIDVAVTINVVFVGFDPALIDTTSIEAKLPRDYSPDIDFTTVLDEGYRSGIRTDLSYTFQHAPAAFADGLFASYPEVARERELPLASSAETPLVAYDRMYGLGKADSGKVWRVDAQAVETWIETHRAAHGLAFAEPEHTVFFLDPWSTHKPFGNDYHYYESTNDTRGSGQTRDLRAFGGTYDFFFMDYGAAPNWETNDNSGITKVDGIGGLSVPATAPEGTAYNDPPMWHYQGDTATIGKGALEKKVKLSDRIAYALDIAVNLRLVGDYAYRPVYKETYYINVHLWHDGRSVFPKDKVDTLLDTDDLFKGLQMEIPWANVTGELTTYIAPEDDPGMDRALTEAKAQGAGSYIPTAPVSKYIDANIDRYRHDDPDAFHVMALLFILEGHYAFVLPVVVGGVAFGSADGTAWGTISSVNDYGYVSRGRDDEAVASSLIGINAHEIGHFFGLMHAHDGTLRTKDGYTGGRFIDHTWSSTNTVMSYRMRPVSSDVFHVDILARAHTLDNLELTFRNVESVYRALDASGAGVLPNGIKAELETATQGHNEARRLFDMGRYVDAVHQAIDARRASDRAMAAVGVTEKTYEVASWDASGVHSAGYKHSAITNAVAVAPLGVRYDYRAVEIGADVQKVTVRAEWENTPTSWGDFFVGWATTPYSMVNLGAVPNGLPLSLGGGIHDDAAEGPLDGKVVRSFTLDLDAMPALRGTTLHMGAGTQGNAVNGAYKVTIEIVERVHGEDDGPDAAASAGSVPMALEVMPRWDEDLLD